MAEILEAILELQIGSFTAALQQAAQQVTAFAQAISGSLGTSAQAFQQQVQQMNQVIATTRQVAQVTKDTGKERIAVEQEIAREVKLTEKEWRASQQEFNRNEREKVAIARAVAKERTALEQTTSRELASIQQQFLKDNAAQEKATGEFIMKQYAEAAAFKLETQKQFLATTLQMAKDREIAEKRSLDAVQAFHQAFFHNALAMARARAAAETQLQKDFFMVTMGLEKERLAQVASTLKAQEDLQRNFFAVTVGMAKAQNEALVSLQKNFLTVTAGFLKERVNDERLAAAQVLAAWTKAGQQLEQMEVTRESREDARFRARNARSNASAASGMNPLGQGLMGPGVVNPTQDLFMLQGWIRLLDEATPKAGFFENAIARIGTSLKTLGGYFAASFIIGIPFALASWAKEALNVALQMQSLEATFRAITGSTAKANQELKFLRDTAQRVGVDFLETTKQFRNLEAAARGTSLEGDKVRGIFEAVVTATRVMGLSSDQSARALLALEQMISKGTISAEELRKQLSQAIPGAVNIMARALGVGTQELSKMMKAGDLMSTEVLPRFAAQMQKEFGPGLEAASKTAQASFARLGNEVRDISIGIGTAILKALQPAADFVAKLLEDTRKARELQQREAVRTGQEILAGKPIAGFQGTAISLAAGYTEQEADEAERIVKRIMVLKEMIARADQQRYNDPRKYADLRTEMAREEESIKAINRAIEERTQRLKDNEARDDLSGRAELGARVVEAEKKYKEQVKEVLALQSQLPMEMQKINALAEQLPTTYGKAEARLQAVKKLQKDYLDLLEKDPDLRLDPGFKKALSSSEAIAHGLQKEIDLRKEQEKAEKDYASETERLAKKRVADLTTEMNAREKMEEELRLIIAGQTEGETEQKIEALNLRLTKARELGADETLMAEAEAAARVKIYAEEYKKFLEYDKGKFSSIENRVDKQEEIEKILASTTAKITKSAVDDFLAAQEVKLKKLKELGAEAGVLAKFTEDTQAAAARLGQQELEKANKAAAREAEKSWRELSNTIENTLAGAFESVLRGSKNLFEGIRDAFLKLLARLAADAVTHAIIIPAIIQVFGGGGGGSGGGGTLGAMGSAGTLGAFGGGGGGSVSSGGSDITGMAMSLAGSAGSIGLGASGFLSGLAATEIGTIGASYGSGVGAAYIGQSTLLGEMGLGSLALGTIVQGLGVGLATAMILKELNNLIGIKGTAGSALAGAGGGAAAGAIIGSPIPGIGTAIGAAIGAVVGAIGGTIAGLVGGKGKQPGFDIESLQAGQIEYDPIVGMRIKQNFKILDDFHQKLGADYEDFIAKMNESINSMFESVVSQVQGAAPEVQKALVEPLNQAFGDVANLIADYPAIGGEKFKEQLEVMMQDFGEIFANTSTGAINKLIDAVKRIDPIVKAFTQIIDHLLENIKELQAQQKALDNTLAGNMKTLEESLMSPAQILLRRKQEFAGLLGEFEGGDEATKIRLAPLIGELSTNILELSKTVFNPQTSFGDLTGIQSAIKQVREAGLKPEESLIARKAELNDLMAQFREGNDAIRTGLTPQITQLALQITQLAGGIQDLVDQQEEQRLELMKDFPSQMRALTGALYSPAQTYLSSQSQLGELLAQFASADSAQQLILEPQIAALAAEIINLASNVEVLGQDPQLLRRTQQDLIAIVQGVQNTIAAQNHTQVSDSAMLRDTLTRTQADVINVLREVEWVTAGSIANAGQQTVQALWSTAGQIMGVTYTMSNGIITASYQTGNGMIVAQYDSTGHLISTEHYIGGVLQGSINHTSDVVGGWSNALYHQQNYLIAVVSHARDIAWVSYNGLMGALWTEVALAQEEIRLLVNALYHLETLDAVIQRALGVLGDMNARLGNPLNVRMDQGIGTQLERDTLQTTQNLLRSQQNANTAIIAMLSKTAYGLDWGRGFDFGRSQVGFQHGGRVPFSMMAYLHQGEQVVPEWENRGGGRNITIQVYGGSKDPEQIANAVIQRIEQKSGRFHSSTIQTSRR